MVSKLCRHLKSLVEFKSSNHDTRSQDRLALKFPRANSQSGETGFHFWNELQNKVKLETLIPPRNFCLLVFQIIFVTFKWVTLRCYKNAVSTSVTAFPKLIKPNQQIKVIKYNLNTSSCCISCRSERSHEDETTSESGPGHQWASGAWSATRQLTNCQLARGLWQTCLPPFF